MVGLSWSEVAVIAAVAFVVIAPQDLLEVPLGVFRR